MGSELLAQCQGYTCLQILNAIFAFTPIYFIFLIFGVFSVLLFSSQMMRQPTYLSSESNDPIGGDAPEGGDEEDLVNPFAQPLFI